MRLDRRQFLRRVTLAGPPILVAAAPVLHARQGRGLDQFLVAAATCTDKKVLTPSLPPDGTFRAGAPQRAVLTERGVPGPPLTLSGVVAGIACGPVRDARIDFWSADAKGVIDTTGFRLRGHQLTNALGGYRMTTVKPAIAGGRAPHVSARVVVPGKATFFTEIFFADDPANAADARYRPELAVRPEKSGDGLTATFDFIFDL